MPTYEYRCRKCEHKVEVRQKVSDAPLTECPKCKGELRRVFHPVGVHFKGSGFYTTDYARKKSAAGRPVGKESEKPGGEGSSEQGAGDKSGGEDGAHAGEKGGEKVAGKSVDAPKADGSTAAP